MLSYTARRGPVDDAPQAKTSQRATTVTQSPTSGGRIGGASAIRTLQDLLRDLKRFGDAPALLAFTADGREEIGFAALTARSLALAGGLMARGLRPGTPVALFAPNSIEWVVCRLALIAADALCVPLDFDADETRVRDLVRDSGARAIFTVEPTIPMLRQQSPLLAECNKRSCSQ